MTKEASQLAKTSAIQARRTTRPRLLFAYALAIALTVFTLFVRFVVLDYKVSDPPGLIFFLIPIILSAYLGGVGPGLVATGLTALLTRYFLLPPLHNFAIQSTLHNVQWWAILTEGVLISVLNEALHRAQRRAEAGETLQAVTLSSIGDAVITTDVQGCISFLNAEAERLTGWTCQEAEGQSLMAVFRIVNEEIREPQEDPVKKVLRLGIAVGLANHTVLIARDGQETPIEDSGAPIKNANGSIAGVVLVFRSCAERRQSEANLRERAALQEQLAKIAATAPGAICSFLRRPDGSSCFPYATPAIKGIYGLTPQELSRDSSPAHRLVHPNDYRRVRASVENSARNLTPWREAYRVRHPDKGEIWIEGHFVPERQPDGSILWHGFLSDVSDRKRAEDELYKKDRMLREAMRAARLVAWDGDLVTQAVQETGPVAELFMRPEGFFHKDLSSWTMSVHPQDRDWVWVRFEAAMRGEESYSLEFRTNPDAAGNFHWVFAVGNVEQDADGTPIRFRGVALDITERKHAEEGLRTSQSQLAAALEAGGMGTWGGTIPNGRIWLDEAAQKLWGLTPAQAANIDVPTLMTMIHPEDRSRLQPDAEDFPRRGFTGRREFRVVRVDGTELWMGAMGKVELDASGQPIRQIGIYMDITARKRAEETQLRSQKLEALGTLAGGIAHDFNNVLLAITGNAKLAADDLPPEHPARASLSEIITAGRRAADLVQRILAFSRPQDQKREIFQLAPVVEEALMLVRATLPAMIEIRTQFTSGLPAIAGDTTQIHQVVVNLATNAAHAIGDRKGLITLRVEAVNVTAEHAGMSAGLREGPYVQLSVSDDGAGMDHLTLEREHVLYVDDEESLVLLASRLLKRLGYSVTGHTDPLAAIKEFRSRPQDFDVVVTDLAMPRMSGFDLAREMRAARPDLPIIMTSGYLRQEDQEMAKIMDINDLVLKPHTVEELGRTLDRLFQAQGASRGTS